MAGQETNDKSNEYIRAYKPTVKLRVELGGLGTFSLVGIDEDGNTTGDIAGVMDEAYEGSSGYFFFGREPSLEEIATARSIAKRLRADVQRKEMGLPDMFDQVIARQVSEALQEQSRRREEEH